MTSLMMRYRVNLISMNRSTAKSEKGFIAKDAEVAKRFIAKAAKWAKYSNEDQCS